jgi:FkbM family methyltransferase
MTTASPHLADMPWLSGLREAASPEALRQALRQRHGAFAEPGRLVILGAAVEGRRLAQLCREHGIAVLAIADDDPALEGSEISGAKVVKTAALAEIDRNVPIVIASHRTLKATQRLRAMGFAHVAPFVLLQMLAPQKFPPHLFHEGWLQDLHGNRAQYEELAGLLADGFSRRVLDAVLGYRLSCDPLVLEPIVEWELYGPAALFSYGEHEVYVDGGSYDGDSVRLFMGRVGGRFDRVLAFEPDPATFTRLVQNFRGEPRVEPVPKGLFSRETTLRFDDAGSRASGLVASGGGIAVPVTTIDRVLGEDPVTFIKMNIEGAEQEALAGAARAIARYRPKLAISAYHRAADLWQIPALVRRLEARYRLYLRQHDGGVIETVLYALP